MSPGSNWAIHRSQVKTKKSQVKTNKFLCQVPSQVQSPILGQSQHGLRFEVQTVMFSQKLRPTSHNTSSSQQEQVTSPDLNHDQKVPGQAPSQDKQVPNPKTFPEKLCTEPPVLYLSCTCTSLVSSEVRKIVKDYTELTWDTLIYGLVFSHHHINDCY